MAGNTGRMTTEALEARGPRMILWSIVAVKNYHAQRVGFAITQEGHMPVPYMLYAHKKARRYAISYNIGYLLRLARAASNP